MPELPQAWVLDSGLRENADFTIASAYFGTTANYQDGKVTLLTLVGLDETTNEMTEKLSVGADWVTSDGGATIVHPTKTNINKNSIYGKWLLACMEIPELLKCLIDRGDPRVSAIWNDLVIRVKRTELTFGPRMNPVTRLMPVEFLGIKTVSAAIPNMGAAAAIPSPAPTIPPLQQPSQPASVSDAVAAARAAAASQASPSPTPAVSPRVAQLIEQAKQYATHDEFMGAIFANTDDVLADDDLANAVADPNGIFATAKA